MPTGTFPTIRLLDPAGPWRPSLPAPWGLREPRVPFAGPHPAVQRLGNRPAPRVPLRGRVPGSPFGGATLTLGVAEAAAVADTGAAPPLHALQMLLVVEVALVEGRREVGQHRVELAQRVRQVPGGRGVQGRGWGQGPWAQWWGRGRHPFRGQLAFTARLPRDGHAVAAAASCFCNILNHPLNPDPLPGLL